MLMEMWFPPRLSILVGPTLDLGYRSEPVGVKLVVLSYLVEEGISDVHLSILPN